MESTAQGSEPSGGLTLTGLDGRVVVVTGAGRRRSIGRAIAVELARAGCDVVLTGTGRPPERYPDDEMLTIAPPRSCSTSSRPNARLM